MSLSAKREYLRKIHGHDQRAGRPQKSCILEEFCLNCGYHRKAALRLMNRTLHRPPRKRPGPKTTYDPAVLLPPLKAIWLLSEQLRSKLLKAARPHWLEHYERAQGPVPTAVRVQLRTISRAQINRLLKPVRVRYPRKGLAAAKPGTPLWPSRHLRPWPPRSRHRGPLRRQHCRQLHQFPNVYRKVPFTRSRANRKNDNAHCEQKNWTPVRQLLGHERFAHLELVGLMNDLYDQE